MILTDISRLLVIFVLISGCTRPQNYQGFTINGKDLLDANGEKFIIQGVNNPHVWYPEEAYNSLGTIASYGANTVRVVWQANGRLSLLDSICSKCIELEMVPMVELHDATGDSTISGLLKTAVYYTKPEVKLVLNKYDKYLLLNIANEWGDHWVSATKWKIAYEKAISLLRDIGYKTTLVIDAPGWGQNIQPVLKFGNILSEYDPLHNILFSVHMYGSWNNPDTIRTKLQEAYDKQLPLIVGEFGYNFEEGNNNLGCRADHSVILQKCTELGYGLMPWSWTGNSGGNEWLDLVSVKDWKTLTDWGHNVFDGEYGISKNAVKASVFVND